MRNKVISNILINTGLTFLFVILNKWALDNSLEETFIFLAIMYGIGVITANACFVLLNHKGNLNNTTNL